MLKSLDNLRAAHPGCRQQISLLPPQQIIRKIGDMKNDDPQMTMRGMDKEELSHMQRIMGSMESMAADRSMQFPQVPEDILRRDMEEDQDNSNHNEPEEE